MLASDIVTLGAAIFGLVTAIAGSSACAYSSTRTGRTNVAVLKVKVHALQNLIQSLDRMATGAVVVRPDPSSWILRAQELLSLLDVSRLEESMHETCMNGLLPNCYVQVRAGRLIEETIAQLDVLIEEGQHISRESTVKGYRQSEVTVAGSSRKQAIEAIWKWVLEKGGTGTLCIHGTTGVGKTTIAIVIHNRALSDPILFDFVIWVPVKYGVGLWQVQEDIASSLQIDISITSDTAERARKLNSTLMQKRRFLLVLDSMWQAFSLKEIGIPEPLDGCKVLVTSRIHSVCKRVTRKEMYEIKPLHVDEALELFENEVGSNLSHLHAETLASTESVVSALDGLPLAIKMLAQILSEIHEENSARLNGAWTEELAVLGSTPTFLGYRDQELFDCFKSSYENLRVETRLCFLFCALFPRGRPIETRELIEYWMWEGLLGRIETLEESMKQGKDTLKELKDAHLLENVDPEEGNEDSVQMLSLVRSMAIDSMANAGHNVLNRSGDSLTDLPPAQDWPSDVEKASFMQNKLEALILRSKPNCKRLTTLLLQGNPLTLDSHDNFFYGMRDLRVLDLSNTMISTLPKSLSNLTNLRALLLRRCPNLRIVPNLSNLLQLIVADFFGTPLDCCPEGVQYLTKLRRLDFSHTRIETFPAKVVGKLIQLEELLLNTDDNGGYVWGSNQTNAQWKGACVEELVALKRLTVLQLNFLNVKVFNRYVKSFADTVLNTSKPSRFRFCVGGFRSGRNAGENSVTVIGDYRVTLPDKTSELHLMMSSEEITLLKFTGSLRDLNVLDVSNFSGLSYLFSVKILGSLKNLRKICVRRCEKMVEVVQPATTEGNPATIFLPELTTMVFYDLPNLKSICCGQVLNCPHLCSFEAWGCGNLKLPMILGRSRGRIEIRGENSWLDNLTWDNPQNLNSLFQDSPQSNLSFRLVGLPVPEYLAATIRVNRKKQCEGSSSAPDVLQKNDSNSSSNSASSILQLAARYLPLSGAAASLMRPASSHGENATAAAADGGPFRTVFDTIRMVNAFRDPGNEGDN